MNKNKKMIGKFKVEYPDKMIKKFICVKPKVYCCVFDDEKELKTLKGIKKSVVKKEINQ